MAALDMSQVYTLSHKPLVADVLHSCFGQGDFKIVVEEVCEDGEAAGDGLCTKRTEFQVWTPLLRRWSDVFASVMGNDQFLEGSRGEMVIKDFSAHAVDAFLRFLYSGTISADLPTLVEVAVIADKYQVQPLCATCMTAVRQKLFSETAAEIACQTFACADRFHLEECRKAESTSQMCELMQWFSQLVRTSAARQRSGSSLSPG